MFNEEPLSQFINSEYSGNFKLLKKRTKRKAKKPLVKKESQGSVNFGSIMGKMNTDFRKKLISPKSNFLKKHTFGMKGPGSSGNGTQLSVVEEVPATKEEYENIMRNY